MASIQSHTASGGSHSYSNSPASSSRHSPALLDPAFARTNSGAGALCSTSISKASLPKKAARRSMSVLGSLPKEISALIRSHSLSRRQQDQFEDVYGDDVNDMAADEDRSSRKSKKENMLYRFLTRSRSRSRSKNGRAPSPDPDEVIPELPRNNRTRNDSMDRMTPSKPSTRLQSRPLSSTTTATNTTITPGTPRAIKRPPSGIAIPDALKDHQLERTGSRPETPKPSSTRKKLHNLFGIPLSSPKKSSFGSSRQSSRRPSFEYAPPLPGYDQGIITVDDNDPTPKPRKSYSPHPNSRSGSPSPRPMLQTRHASGSSTNTSSTSASSRLQKFFSAHRTTPPPSVPSTDSVSGPLRRPSGSSHYRSNSNQSHRIPSPVPGNSAGTMGPPPVPPKIMHTPATPLRSDQPPRPATAPLSQSRSGHRNNSADSGYRYQGGGTMEMVDESTISDGGKGKGRAVGLAPNGIPNGTARLRPLVHGHASRSTKHGSFDFERPGWSAGGAIQRTGSNGTTTTGTSSASGHWGRNHDNLGGIRESTMGPGLAGVGTLQRDVSLKRGKEREELMKRAREDERRRKKGEPPGPNQEEKDHGSAMQRHRSLQPPPRKSESEESGGKSSSLGKKRGGLVRAGSGGGKGRATTLGLAHGPFPFEPPVPSPTRSTGSTGRGGGHDAALSVSWGGERGRGDLLKDRGRVGTSGDRNRERTGGRSGGEKRPQTPRAGDRAPVPVPAPNIGYRSGTKGRSLDLGLGLAWAPTKLREDALLPGSGYFGRSLSGTSSVEGRSATARADGVDEKERSKVGREVAEVFKSALDDDGYAAFKKYVHRFDAHDIPFDGPAGIVSRVEHLLTTAPALSDEGKRRLLDSFVRIILQNA